MHVIFVEPAFPRNQREFPRALHKAGAKVTAIGEYPIEAIDSTGAGDVFAGAFLAAWTRGYSLTAAVDFANAAAAMSVLELGSVTGLKNFAQTLRWQKARRAAI